MKARVRATDDELRRRNRLEKGPERIFKALTKSEEEASLAAIIGSKQNREADARSRTVFYR